MKKMSLNLVVGMIIDSLQASDANDYPKIRTAVNDTLDSLERDGYTVNHNYDQDKVTKIISKHLVKKGNEEPIQQEQEHFEGGVLNKVEENKTNKIKTVIKDLIKEEISNINLRSTFTKYVNEIQDVVKSLGNHISVTYKTDDTSPKKLGHILVDDGEGGFAFTMTIFPEKRNSFSVNYTLGGKRSEHTANNPMSMDDLKKWLKGDFKKMLKELEKEPKVEKIEDESKEVEKKDIEKQIDKDDVKADIKVKKDITPQEGGSNVGKIDRKEDAKMVTKHIAHDEKELKLKSKKDGMEKTKIKRQESMKSKMPEKPAKTKDIKKSHIIKESLKSFIKDILKDL